MSAGLLRTVLHRSRADWPVVLASWVLLTSALALLAAGTLYSDAVTLAGLRRELRDAPAADRAVVVRTRILPERIDAADPAAVTDLVVFTSFEGVDGPLPGGGHDFRGRRRCAGRWQRRPPAPGVATGPRDHGGSRHHRRLAP